MCAAATATSTIPTVAAIAVAVGAGALDDGCKDGPDAFRRYWESQADSRHARLVWETAPRDVLNKISTPSNTVARTSRWLATTTSELAQAGKRFLVIGGDHSCAIGTWNGAADALQGSLGIIWIDAHMDMHVPETTPSGAINGMALAALLGYGAAELTAVSNGAIAFDRICLIGVRSFEPEEVAFAKRHGVHVIGIDELRRRGIEDAFAEACAVAGGATRYGVSLDLDAFDPADAPGVGTPEPHGIRAREFIGIWAGLTCDPSCVGVEIVEYNPGRDRNGRTARLMGDLVNATVREERLRWVG